MTVWQRQERKKCIELIKMYQDEEKIYIYTEDDLYELSLYTLSNISDDILYNNRLTKESEMGI